MRSATFARSTVLLALALSLAGPARAADPGTYVPPKRPTAPAAPAPEQKPAPVISDQGRVAREKRTFMDAADLCVRRDTCDQELLKNAEKKFVAACEMCAPIVDCENEREAILAGKATKSNPCAVAAAAEAKEQKGAKGKPSAAAAAMAARKAAAEKKAAQAKAKPAAKPKAAQ